MSLASIKIGDGNSNINYSKKCTAHSACVDVTVRHFHDFVKIEFCN